MTLPAIKALALCALLLRLGGAASSPRFVVGADCDREPGTKDKYGCCNEPAPNGQWSVRVKAIEAGQCFEVGQSFTVEWDVITEPRQGGPIQSKGTPDSATVFPIVAFKDPRPKSKALFFARSTDTGVCVSQRRATFAVPPELFRGQYDIPAPIFPDNPLASFSVGLQSAFDEHPSPRPQRIRMLSAFPDPNTHNRQQFQIARDCKAWEADKGPVFGPPGSGKGRGVPVHMNSEPAGRPIITLGEP